MGAYMINFERLWCGSIVVYHLINSNVMLIPLTMCPFYDISLRNANK